MTNQYGETFKIGDWVELNQQGIYYLTQNPIQEPVIKKFKPCRIKSLYEEDVVNLERNFYNYLLSSNSSVIHIDYLQKSLVYSRKEKFKKLEL
jgi:hypothetical protein